MAKTDNTLEALKQLKRALSQGRDIASSALGLMIKRVEGGGDLEPNPEYVRAPRQPMAPMAVRAAPAPEPVAKPKAKAKAKSKAKSEPPRDGVEPPKTGMYK